MILEDGGQQLVGFTPAARSGGPHVLRSGGEIGAATAKGLLFRVTAPQSPPRPTRTFLLFPTISTTSSSEAFGISLFLFPLHLIPLTFGYWNCGNGWKEEGRVMELGEKLLTEDTKER
ncbi:hypothetical protein V8G54_032642 [Vigna mungo]|uniref:Uncharacterized protein n=1 Tax=Vigna mungo TaxID=3915 RepID=A0AAQ3MN92_VIGMU